MPPEENKAVVRRFVEEVQNQHNLAAIDDLLSPDFVDHSGTSELPGREGSKRWFAMMFTAFPDMHFTIQQQIAEGDKVVTFKTFQGTHEGPFMGIPATGREVTVDAMDIYAVRGGRLVEHWSVADFLGMLQQLGDAPAGA